MHRYLLLFLVLSLFFFVAGATFADTIVGSVVDSSGQPVVGAAVYLFADHTGDNAKTLTTDSSGSFTADVDKSSADILNGNSFSCVVDAKGYGVIGERLSASDENRITLAPAVTVGGKVVDGSGDPVAGAVVRADNAYWIGTNYGYADHYTDFGIPALKGRFTTKTDAKGIYSISGLPSHLQVDVVLDDPLYVSANTYTSGTSAPPLVAKPGTVISGKVIRQDGKAVGAVDVQATSLPDGHYGSRAITKDDGSFELIGLAPGQYRLTVYPTDNYSASTDWAAPPPLSVTTSLGPPTTSPNIVLTLGCAVSGLVLDADTKKAVPGALVQFVDPGMDQGQRYTGAITDSNGRYTAHVWAGAVDVSLLAKDYAADPSKTLTFFTAVEGQMVSVDPILISRGLTAAGKVIADDGKPLAGITVQSQRSMTSGQVYYFADSSSARTAADGTYELMGLLPGAYTVTAVVQNDSSSPAKYAEPVPVNIVVTPGKPVTISDIILSKAVVVTGLVVDAVTKAPISGVRIGIQDSAGSTVPGQQVRSVNAITDQNGRFTVAAWPGNVELYVYDVPTGYANDSARTQRALKVIPGQPLTVDPISIDHAIIVTGIAVDDSGQPLANLTLQTQKSQTDGGWMNIPPATTDKNGKFLIDQLLAGSYSIDAGTDWTVVSPSSFTVPSPSPIKLILKKTLTTTIQGTAVDTDGAPLAGVTISFIVMHMLANGTAASNVAQATTDNTGYFSLPDVPISQSPVQINGITKDGYALQSGGVLSMTGNHQTISVIVMAKLGGDLAGIVRNGLGEPVADAWVACPNTDGDVRPVETDAGGHFKLTDLVIGPVDIYAAKGDYYGHLSAQTSGTKDQTVTVTLEPSPLQPVPVDLVEATQALAKLYPNAATSNLPEWRCLDDCAYALEVVSPTAGLNFLGQHTNVNSGDVNWIASAQAAQNPQATAQWVIPLLKSVPDNGYTGTLAVTIGLDVAPYDSASAKTLYAIAASNISLDNLNNNVIESAMSLVALAYALKQPEADSDYGKVLAEINREYASGTQDADWLLQDFAQTLARGNVDLALKLLSKLPAQAGRPSDIKPQIVSELVNCDPAGALTVFHTIDPDNATDSWAYGEAFVRILPLLFKSDAAGAEAAAKALIEPRSRSEALTMIADALPIDRATPLYEVAETDSMDQDGQGSTPASIAAHAYLRDKALGAKLFAEAFDKVMSTAPSNQQWSGPSYAEFAFYYSRIDPGYSKLLLENQFHKDLMSPTPNNPMGHGMVADVAAMAAIDPVRAEAMAASIKTFDQSFQAGLKAAQYIALPNQMRDTLPFDDWESNSEWTPDPSAPW